MNFLEGVSGPLEGICWFFWRQLVDLLEELWVFRELVDILDGVSGSFGGSYLTFWRELVYLLEGVSVPFGGS